MGETNDQWAPLASRARPLRVVLLGCGVVGRGVYERVKRYPDRFEICHVVVGDVAKYAGVDHLTSDVSVVLNDSIDIVIESFGGVGMPYPLISAAFAAGKFAITANKALVAAHWKALSCYARAPQRRLWYSAAVGGALPVLETLSSLESVGEIRGIVNGTCGVVLAALADGQTREQAVAMAQAGGFAEADPRRDLSGLDSADKLVLMMEAAFGEWLAPDKIPTRGIDTIADAPLGYQLIARARRTRTGITASVGPELSSPDSFLGQARGPENRIEIDLTSGEVVRLRGQGAGRWPTALSVLGDLHEVARLAETLG